MDFVIPASLLSFPSAYSVAQDMHAGYNRATMREVANLLVRIYDAIGAARTMMSSVVGKENRVHADTKSATYTTISDVHETYGCLRQVRNKLRGYGYNVLFACSADSKSALHAETLGNEPGWSNCFTINAMQVSWEDALGAHKEAYA